MAKRPDPYHEVEVLVLIAEEQISRNRLQAYLLEHGFIAEDEFYYLPRKDEVYPWQSSSAMTVDVKLNTQNVYQTKEDVDEGNATFWNELCAQYLLASLPRHYLVQFVDRVFQLAEAFSLNVFYYGQRIEKDTALAVLSKIADQVAKEHGDPGSEVLGILIQMNNR